MLFDIRCFHCAMPNVSTTGQNREGLIVRFSQWTLKSGMSTHGKMLEANGQLEGRSSLLRQLLGLGLAGGGTDPLS